MTSNIGSEYIPDNNENSSKLVEAELHSTFKPEFLNRIDEIITFNPLSKNILYKILDNQILDINKRLINKHIIIELTDNCKNIIIEEAYNPIYGARPLKRYLSKNIESLIAKAIISDDIKPNSKVLIDYVDNKYVIRKNQD